MANYLQIARRVIAEQDAAKVAEQTPGTARDRQYIAAFEAGMSRMRANPMPEACLPWLAENEPGLYRMLTKALPDRLQEVWGTPGFHLLAFEWVLDRIWDAHRKARKLYFARANGNL